MRLPVRQERGFTLLETLVTLVIVAMVAGLVAEGLFQLSRIERSLQGGQALVRLEALHRQWAVQTIHGLVAAGSRDEAQFLGTATELRGASTLAPGFESFGPMPIRMTLEPSSAQTSLVLTVTDVQGKEQRVELARWPGNDLHWVFEDDAGQSYLQWPPAGQVLDQALPRLIRLEQGKGDVVLLLGAPQNSYLRWGPNDWGGL